MNPLLPGFWPDPSICRVGADYYLANSSFEYVPGIPLHHSTDLVTWTPIGHAIDRPGQLDLSRVRDSGGLYAPALRYSAGTFYLACTVVGESPDAGSFYVTATDPRGDWSDPVFLPDAIGFDPSMYFADDGRVWWVQCREKADGAYEGETEVWLRELDLAAGALVGPEHLIGGAKLKGGRWAEGPHIHHRDGWFYLLTAEGGTELAHAVMVARSRTVTGPYEPFAHNPILTHRHLGRTSTVRSVGHLDLVDDPAGGWHAVALASRQVGDRVVLGRETFGAEIGWEDGWPVVNPGIGQLSGVVDRPQRESGSPATSDDFLSVRTRAHVEDRTDGILLAPDDDGRGGLWRRLLNHRADVRIGARLLDPDARVRVGLRQSDAFGLALEVGPRETSWIEIRDGVERVHRTAHATIDSAFQVELQVRTDVVEAVLRSGDALRTLGAIPVDVLTVETAGGFVGTTYGVRAIGPASSRVLVTDWAHHGI